MKKADGMAENAQKAEECFASTHGGPSRRKATPRASNKVPYAVGGRRHFSNRIKHFSSGFENNLGKNVDRKSKNK